MSNTGGPAFPTEKTIGLNTDGTWLAEIPGQKGMTLRDYFAAKAMQGFMANKSNPMRFDPENDASWAYTIADAMLKAREQK